MRHTAFAILSMTALFAIMVTNPNVAYCQNRVLQVQREPSLQRETATHTSAPRVSESEFPPLLVPEKSDAKTKPTSKTNTLAGPALTMGSSLVVVLGLFAGMVWVTRRFGSRAGGGGVIPENVLQNLGSTAIDPRTRITMLRCGDRIVVLAQTASGIHPISEITNPEEVLRVTAECMGKSQQTFAATLKSLEREPTAPGFIEQPTSQPIKRGRLFATA